MLVNKDEQTESLVHPTDQRFQVYDEARLHVKCLYSENEHPLLT